MFTITQDGPVLRMQSPTSMVEILPDCGAILNRWQVQMHDRAWEVIEGYDSPEDFAGTANQRDSGVANCRPMFAGYPMAGNIILKEKNTGLASSNLAGSSIHGLLYNVPL